MAAPLEAPTKLAEPVPASEEKPLGKSRTQSDQAPKTLPGTGSWALRTLGALGLVIALIMLVRLVIQKASGNTAGFGSKRMAEVLGRTAIGNKTYVVFMRLADRIVAVAQSPVGMQTLTTFDDPEQVAAIMADFEAQRPQSITQGFRQALSRFDRDHTTEGDVPVEAVVNDEGLDHGEQHVDRTRDSISGLISKVRSFDPNQEGTP